jgi:hypothetical protein
MTSNTRRCCLTEHENDPLKSMREREREEKGREEKKREEKMGG